jgi:hypothetical protein
MILINTLKTNGKNMYYTLTISATAFCIYGPFITLTVTAIISLNSVKQLIFVMVKCGVLFEVRTEFLNNI